MQTKIGEKEKMKPTYKKTYKKLLFGKELASCWFCQSPTQHAAYESDGSEIWCCIGCLWNEEKLKQFNPKTRKYSTFQKKLKNDLLLCVGKRKVGVSTEDLNP